MQNHEREKPFLSLVVCTIIQTGFKRLNSSENMGNCHMFQELNLYCDSLLEASDPLMMRMTHNAVFGWQHSVTWKTFSTQNQDIQTPWQCTDGIANSWTRWFQHTSLGRGIKWALNSAYLCRDLFWYEQSLVWPDAHQLYCHLVALHCRCHQRQVGMLRRLGHVRCLSNDSDKGWVGRKQVLSLYFDYKQDKTKRFCMMIPIYNPVCAQWL